MRFIVSVRFDPKAHLARVGAVFLMNPIGASKRRPGP
jgi:hypothetical protein